MSWHPRTQKVRLAQIDITRSVIEIAQREGLTFVETVQAVGATIDALSRDALRTERHPKDPDKGADEP